MKEPEIKLDYQVKKVLEFKYTPVTERTLFFISDLMTGSIHIKQKIETQEKMAVDVSHLPSGMYMLCIVDGEKRFEKKFQKL